MITATPLDVLALFLIGILAGYLYRHKLYFRLPDWNVKLAFLCLGGYALIVIGYNTLNPTGPLFYSLPLPIAAVYFCSYPGWYLAGVKLSYAIFGKHPPQGGLRWLLKTKE